MLWLLKDVGAFILGIAGVYLLCFGRLSRQGKDNDPGLPRVWMTYVALAIASIGVIVWLAQRVFNR